MDAVFILNAALVDAPGDPKDDVHNPLRYIANNTLTGIAVSTILLVGIIQVFLIVKYNTKWMLPMTIAVFLFAFGLSLRFALHNNPTSTIIYSIQYLFVSLSPCGFIAADYILLGRLAMHLNAGEYLLLPKQKITRIFVSSDVITFLIQAGGGGLTASATKPSTINLGSHIFLVGLIIQLVSFILFAIIFATLLYRIYTQSQDTWTSDQHKKWHDSWLALAGALLVSCIGILIRSTFRVIEASEGFDGHLTRSERAFYSLDTLPLFIAIAVYIPLWPGRFIKVPSTSNSHDEEGSSVRLNELR